MNYFYLFLFLLFCSIYLGKDTCNKCVFTNCSSLAIFDKCVEESKTKLQLELLILSVNNPELTRKQMLDIYFMKEKNNINNCMKNSRVSCMIDKCKKCILSDKDDIYTDVYTVDECIFTNINWGKMLEDCYIDTFNNKICDNKNITRQVDECFLKIGKNKYTSIITPTQPITPITSLQTNSTSYYRNLL